MEIKKKMTPDDIKKIMTYSPTKPAQDYAKNANLKYQKDKGNSIPRLTLRNKARLAVNKVDSYIFDNQMNSPDYSEYAKKLKGKNK